MPPPRGAELLDPVDVLGRVNARELLAGRRAAPRRARVRASSAASRAASIATIRPAFSGWAPVSCSSEEGWRDVEAHGCWLRYPRSVASRSLRVEPATSPSSAAAPRASTSRSRRPSARRAGRRSSRASRSPRAPASGPRAGSPPRSPPTTPPSATPRTPSTRAAGSADRARSRRSSREAPAAVDALEERGVRFDRDPDGGLALGLEGGHSARRIVHAGGAETGRALTSRLAELVAADDADRGARGRLGDWRSGATASAAPA